jgi:hypothetical protein
MDIHHTFYIYQNSCGPSLLVTTGKLKFQTRTNWDEEFAADGHTDIINMLEQTIKPNRKVIDRNTNKEYILTIQSFDDAVTLHNKV